MSEWGSRKYKYKADGNEKDYSRFETGIQWGFQNIKETQTEMSMYLKNPVIQLKLKWKFCK